MHLKQLIFRRLFELAFCKKNLPKKKNTTENTEKEFKWKHWMNKWMQAEVIWNPELNKTSLKCFLVIVAYLIPSFSWWIYYLMGFLGCFSTPGKEIDFGSKLLSKTSKSSSEQIKNLI